MTYGAKFNFGAAVPSGVHAPSATPDGQGGVLTIFNMNPGKPTKGWNQIMTLPRRLTVVGDELAMEPAGDLESLRRDHQRVGKTTLPANEELVLDAVRGNAMEIVAEIDPQDAPMIELNVLRAPGRAEYTRIAFFKNRGFSNRVFGSDHHQSLISLDTSYSSVAPDVLSRAPETAPVILTPGETLKLRVFVDKSVVEVFANDQQCVAARVYPDRADSVGVSLRAQGQSAELLSLDAYQMQDIYAE